MPRVIVIGPPGAQASSLCDLIASKQDLVHVVASEVLVRELARAGSEAGANAKALVDNGSDWADIPPELQIEMLREKLNDGDCATKGYVLEGFPKTAAQARSMLAAGLLPTRVLHATLDDTEVLRRLTGRRVDPEHNFVYHLEDSPPPDAETAARLVQRADDTEERVAARLAEYQQAMRGVLPQFSKVHAACRPRPPAHPSTHPAARPRAHPTPSGSAQVLREIDGSLPNNELLEAALPHITAEHPTRAPRGCPRVLLLGGPGSNSAKLGEALSEAYGATMVSAADLLHSAKLSGSKMVAQAIETGDLTCVEDIIGPLVLARLQKDDVRTRGFVLEGFPATAAQAAWLKKQGVWIRHAIHLDMTPEDATRSVTGIRFDPLNGDMYHVDGTLAPRIPADADVMGRLAVHPKHEPAYVRQGLKVWASKKEGLLKAYANVLSVEDGLREQGELVERLAPCFLTLN